MVSRVWFIGLGLFLAVCSLRGAVIFVHSTAGGVQGDGTSWATAFATIPQALKHTASGDELWVAAGTYEGAIEIPAGVAVFGGFAGNETARTQRDWEHNRTIIDWDEWNDEYPSDYLKPRPAVSLNARSKLDGFIVLNGNHAYGAGIYAGHPGATVANNVIVTNQVTGIPGGALLIDRPGSLPVTSDFFVKTASDLLRQQFPFGATNIPVAQYGPTVHRLLQVAANVYDAARRDDAYPAVFRPQFTSTPDGVIISGYYQDKSADTIQAWLATNPYSIPMIVATRKGFPNFNELTLQTAVFAARRLEFRRHDTNSSPFQTNEMYIIGISNFAGIEAWNSYTQAFQGPLELKVANHLTLALTNSEGLNVVQEHVFSVTNTINSWPGFAFPHAPTHPSSQASFLLPIFTNSITVTNSVYRLGPPAHLEDISATNSFAANSGFRTPDWQLSISNTLTYVLSAANRIIDFVYLANLTNHLNLSRDLLGISPVLPGETIIARCWDTNRITNPGGGPPTTFTPTAGIQAQIDISLGYPTIQNAHWREYSLDTQDKDAAIQSFREFVFPAFYPNNNTNLIQRAPFTPARKLVMSVNWEANDPHVHALPEHLKGLTNNFAFTFVRPMTGEMVTNQTLGRLNGRYEPWFGNPYRALSPEDVDPRIKDPMVQISQDFDFPFGPEINVRWLDRIHRGTPWQTLYLDNAVAPASVWNQHALDPLSHPTNDWKIIEYLRSRLVYDDPSLPTRILNNTVVGNDGGVWIANQVNAVVMNNAVAYNSSGIFAEDGDYAGFTRNCVFGNDAHNNGDISESPQFVDGDFSVLVTSPLIDGGTDAVLAWIQRNVLGLRTDIGAFEYKPQAMPVFTMKRTVDSACEMELRGFPGQTYVIEASTNLSAWSAISTNLADMGRVIFSDAHGTNFPHRFYRAKLAE